jgi:hypothetical protein
MQKVVIGNTHKRPRNTSNMVNTVNTANIKASPKRPRYTIGNAQQPQQPQQPEQPRQPFLPLSIKIPVVKYRDPNNSMNEEDMQAYTVNTTSPEWSIPHGNTRFNDPIPLNLQYGFTRYTPPISTHSGNPSPSSTNLAKTRRRRNRRSARRRAMSRRRY